TVRERYVVARPLPYGRGSLEWRRIGQKLTFGASRVSGPLTSKYGLAWKPVTPATKLVGTLCTLVLYARTASLYRVRATAMRFSVPASSSCKRMNSVSALRLG